MSELGWGLQISALGMGLVFGLLALLWLLLTLVLKFDKPAQAAPAVSAQAAMPAPLEAAVLAAIGIAVLRHRASGESAEVRRHSPGSLLYASRWVAAGRVRQNHSWRRSRGR
jgi:Na+-transporting methylmalonyl-CoA/oxaloacetate decarboxylase gamma subunit